MLKSLFSKGGNSTQPSASPAQTEVTEEAEGPRSRTYTVGWYLQKQKTSMIWDSPKPFRPDVPNTTNAKSVAKCPAVLDFDRRYFVINSPIDLHMRLTINNGEIGITNMLWDKSPVRPTALQQMVVFQPQEEWRHPNRPVLQMMTSYIFVTDDPLYIDQYPPFLHYNDVQRPGVQLSGRFPVDIWPRALMWAFEWHDTSKDLILKRGEPLFYVSFEGPDPSAAVRMIEAKRTQELEDYVDSITGVTEYVSQSYSLFKTARERRPARLLYPKD
jgi:hypothetical protein